MDDPELQELLKGFEFTVNHSGASLQLTPRILDGAAQRVSSQMLQSLGLDTMRTAAVQALDDSSDDEDPPLRW